MNEQLARLIEEHRLLLTRRHFFNRVATGIGTAALASALNPALLASPPAGSITGKPSGSAAGMLASPHLPPRVRRIIYLFMADAPSQMDLFDYKPKMDEWYDKDLPDSVRNGQRITTMT